MPRKARRRARKGARRPPRPKPGIGAPSKEVRPPSAEGLTQPAPSAPRRLPPELAAEYRYVSADLRRIGLLTAAIFAILLLLALFLR